jgi:hypothetical protein
MLITLMVLSTPQNQLSLKPISYPLKKKAHTYQQVLTVEGGDEEMEADVTTQ